METRNIKNITTEQQESIDNIEIKRSYDEYRLDLEVLIKDFQSEIIYTKWTDNSHLEYYFLIKPNGDFESFEKEKLLRLLF